MIKKIFYIFIISAYVLTVGAPFVYAQTTTDPTVVDLKSKIDDRNAKIQQLEAEIKQYNAQVNVVSTEAKTLQSTVKTLDLTQKKITADISLTQNKILKTNYTIAELNDELDRIAKQISANKDAVISGMQAMQSTEDLNVVQMVLSSKNIKEAWDDLENIRQLQSQIRQRSIELQTLTENLQTKQDTLLGQKKSLVNLKEDLNGKKQAIEYTKQEKATLLAQTKNKEQAFKTLIQTKEQQKAQFEKELYDFEAQLNLTVDRGSYPSGQHGILAWPLENVSVNQLFGKTVGAEKLYTSGSHNGVDFRASIGTRVMSAGDGTVVGTGNTDAYPGCYSFGKWVMVKHPNGLSTIYGHLSVISVTTGQDVSTGQTLGYSGNTGYSTGPHLHLGVYATQGVRIEKYVNSRGCKQATIPLADIKAYLDPMIYLPVYSKK